MPPPLLRNEIFDTPSPSLPLWIENTGNNLRIYQKDVLTHSLCDFTTILLMDIVLTLPTFAKKFMIIQIIQT